MKVKGFLQDVGGASRVSKARLEAFANASAVPVREDPIAAVAREWHPGKQELVVTSVEPCGKTCVTVRFERPDGGKLPMFYAGQYMVIDFPIGESLISRPYSISSAPYQARLPEHGFVEITVKRSKGGGFISDYINESVKPGDRFMCNVGLGQFYYEPLRDAAHAVALAGGVGITPFVSMAREIRNGTLDLDLTILYGSMFSNDITMFEELSALEGERVHVVHVISGDDPGWQGERGFITADLIRRYSAEDTTYFVCGPQAMYAPMEKALKELDVPKRRIRFEVFGQVKDITKYPGFPAELADTTFELTVMRGIHKDVIPAKATESLVMALERAGIRVETGCRSGECGFCRTKLLSGNVYISPVSDGRRAADKEFGYLHACAAYPLSDVSIKIPIL